MYIYSREQMYLKVALQFVPTEEKYIWKWPWSVDTYITEYVYMKVAVICYSVQLHLNPVEILYLPQNVALEYWLKYLLC